MLAHPLLVCVLIAGPALPAQHVDGVVIGFDAMPAAHAVVRVFADDGAPITEVVADERGRFALDADRAVGRVAARIDGVEVAHTVPAAARELRFEFQNAPHFTLQGHLVDPGGRPCVGVDVLVLDDQNRAITLFTTAAKGAYELRVDCAVGAMLVDPMGWSHRVPGPWTQSQGVALDLRLRRDEFFGLTGIARDDGGAPLADALVEARAQGRVAGAVRTDALGHYRLWTKKPPELVEVRVDGLPRAQRLGPFAREAIVDLDEHMHGFALIAGTVIDDHGHPVASVQIFATDADHDAPLEPRMLGSTRRDGTFVVRVPRCQPFVCAPTMGNAFLKVPWREGERVEIAPPH
ncbi:MAG: carboxypeptidase-like regulatory domain-containing protein [Planctomycetota bacterium]